MSYRIEEKLKVAKGKIFQLQNWIIKNKIKESADLMNFNEEGYRFSKSESTESEPVFLRK